MARGVNTEKGNNTQNVNYPCASGTAVGGTISSGSVPYSASNTSGGVTVGNLHFPRKIQSASNAWFAFRLQKLVKDKSPEVTGVHCVIHRQKLACKTMPPQLFEMMSTIIKIVNFIKSSALNTWIFRELCEDTTASHQNLLFYTQVRWLSEGNVLKRVQILLPEIKVFLDQNAKYEFLALISDEKSEVLLSYLVYIFDRINSLNLSLQGKNEYIFDLNDKLKAFQTKLQFRERLRGAILRNRYLKMP